MAEHCKLPCDKTILQKLRDHYGSNILITAKPGKATLICFIDSAYEKLSKDLKLPIDREERHSYFLDIAIDIVRSDMRAEACETEEYPDDETIFHL